MATFHVDIREAKRTNGHASEDPVTAQLVIRDVRDWFHARETVAKAHSLDVWDPAIFAVQVGDDDPDA